ncbi:low molecular weight protein-tyrosine-phosphatase [Lysobacter terrae]
MSSSGAPRIDFAIRRILVVCLGNVCRSPIAEYVLRERLAARDITVESAGIGAEEGAPIDPFALQVLSRHGIDASRHVARRLDRAMLERADLVLLMEHAHLAYVRSRVPSAAGKAFLLRKWHDGEDVPDPFGQPIQAFEQVYATVELGVTRWCELI